MLRRLVACLLAIMCLTGATALAAGPYDLAILSQWDERFYDNDFYYNDNQFRFGGCGPASVTNALVAVLDVTDQDLAAGMERDVMYLLTDHRPAHNTINIARLSYLNSADGPLALDPRYPSLNQALLEYNGRFIYDGLNVTAVDIEEALGYLDGSKALYHGTMAKSNFWPGLVEIVDLLMSCGYQNSLIVVGFLSAGTETTAGPFRSGTAGHYLSLYIHVQEFAQAGTFYVLDSFPRALEDEPCGTRDATYNYTYDFVNTSSRPSALAAFTENFELERIQPTVLRVLPTGEARDALRHHADDEQPIDALLPYLDNIVKFYNSPHIFIVLHEM